MIMRTDALIRHFLSAWIRYRYGPDGDTWGVLPGSEISSPKVEIAQNTANSKKECRELIADLTAQIGAKRLSDDPCETGLVYYIPNGYKYLDFRLSELI
jgi:hypothetical protein